MPGMSAIERSIRRRGEKFKGKMMEREKKVKYLKGYFFATREIKQIQEELQALSYDFGLKSPNVNGTPGGSGTSDLSKYVIKEEELEKKIDERKEKQLQIMTEIRALIEGLEDSEERLILRYRYLILDKGHLMTWERIGELCNYSRISVIRIHEHAIEHLFEDDTK